MGNLPLFSAGGLSVVAGGLAAAVTGPTGWSHGSWVAAFLVLVTGVAQVGVGAGQAHLAPVMPGVAFTVAQCVLWNAGCAIVILGTLVSIPVMVLVGSAPLVAVLAMSMVAVKGFRAQRSPFLLVYRLMLLVLLVNRPGLVGGS